MINQANDRTRQDRTDKTRQQDKTRTDRTDRTRQTRRLVISSGSQLNANTQTTLLDRRAEGCKLGAGKGNSVAKRYGLQTSFL